MDSLTTYKDMPYRQLGPTGLKVSALSLGSWINFGHQVNQSLSDAMVDYALLHGINYFDTAESYAQGEAERILGQSLKRHARHDYVISTKLFWGGDKPNFTGLSRKHLVEGLNQSLERLNLDHVDILFCHRPDPSVPMEEVVRTMNHFIQQGLIFYWGTSQWPITSILEAQAIATKYQLEGPVVEQCRYNLFYRTKLEVEYQRLFMQYQYGTTIWSPLAGGILSGKYQDGIPAQSRFGVTPQWCPKDLNHKVQLTQALIPLAKAQGCSVAQLALAWCLHQPHVSNVILGATNLEQLKENIASVHINLNESVLNTINRHFS